MGKEIYLYGASGHGKVIKDIAENCGKQVIAFIDDYPIINEIKKIPVFEFNSINNKKIPIVISIGNNRVRKKISQELNVNFDVLIDPSANISKEVKIKKGTVVMPNSVVNSHTEIGEHVIINTGAVVEHDCIIKNFVHISPNATITGGVSIEEGTHIGAGAIIIPNIKIGKWVTIGAGAVIIEDIPDYAVVVGNPGRIVKYKEVKI